MIVVIAVKTCRKKLKKQTKTNLEDGGKVPFKGNLMYSTDF